MKNKNLLLFIASIVVFVKAAGLLAYSGYLLWADDTKYTILFVLATLLYVIFDVVVGLAGIKQQSYLKLVVVSAVSCVLQLLVFTWANGEGAFPGVATGVLIVVISSAVAYAFYITSAVLRFIKNKNQPADVLTMAAMLTETEDEF